jgi:SAM-dependent MidA family methyltransferase
VWRGCAGSRGKADLQPDTANVSYNQTVNRPQPPATPGSVASAPNASGPSDILGIQPDTHPDSSALLVRIAAAIEKAGGWISFETYMALALYTPGLGYYSRGDRQFGLMPTSGSDFVTAPELSPLFGRALARQVVQALHATGTREVWEFGAGSGALAAQLLGELGERITRYTIVDLSGTLRARQRQRIEAAHPALVHKVCWLDALPERFDGVVVANELLDAMPVTLLHWDGHHWHDHGVALEPGSAAAGAPRLRFADHPTHLAPPVDQHWPAGAVVELPRIAVAYILTLAERLKRGAAFFIDYGFPEHEFYHPQRSAGTLMCHRAHRADTEPLIDPGDKDITAHVDFTAIAVAAQDAGMAVLGYTSQARFLMNCGLVEDLEHADLRERAMAQKLITEHEMGELFKVLGLASAGWEFDAIGFAAGDRSHTL